MVEIYAIDQEKKLDGMTFSRMMNLVSKQKNKRINKFIKWKDAQRSLIADVLVRFVVSRNLKQRINEISFLKNSYGKPFLNNAPHLSFNISHSGKWVVCAFSKHDVGVDVEKIKPTDFGIAKRFFSHDEYEYIMNRAEEDRLEAFYDLWTLKESYIKAIGKGLYKSLDEFTINISNRHIYLNDQNTDESFSFKQYSIDKHYKLSLCVSGEIQKDKCYIYSLYEFVNLIEEERSLFY